VIPKNAGEVSRAKSGSRKGLETSSRCAVVALEGPVVTAEEEQLVLLNRAAQSPAQIIENALALARAYCCSLEELPCPQGLILMVLKKNSVELIAAGLGDDGDGRAAGDRKSTRLNSSHVAISYAVFCL